jgi:DNA mismatch endonuclease (patch repair protein)
MARIRAKDTAPEMAVRKMASAMGRRYRLHVRKLPGCPDLVFARDRKIVFVHGCFWHPHARCSVGHAPASRVHYWGPKLEGNRVRDQRNQRKLRRAGWAVLTIRECELANVELVRRRLAEFLAPAALKRAHARTAPPPKNPLVHALSARYRRRNEDAQKLSAH